ncbi:hypothetical protein ACFFHM_06255 [Halalkalibacter kiskunsagensis]|uniref:Uncharacterized protein n=1 Tax=Halalkalibacter kiskunsagensis TaxID=1548599 RepID=A0ABV6KAS2_9BACI
MDQSLTSIFTANESEPEVSQSMRDIASLAGVLKDLGSQDAFQSPGEILRFLRIIQLINEEALGLDDPIENEETVFYRYQNRFTDEHPPSKKRVEQVIRILINNNWMSKQSKQLKMRDLGKRMMDMLIRLANDSLAYYKHDDIGRSLFQARRDAELSEAYDDKGISGGNKIASIIRNVENAIQLMKERELEMLADRNALPQLELIHGLMEDLDVKLKDRFRQFQTVEESLVLTNLMQKGTAVLAEGTNLSLGMINKFLKFTHMQETPLSSNIQPEKVRDFITKMFAPPLHSDVPNAHHLLSFMEQNQYEDEAIDGLWIPVKFAAPLSPIAIDEGIHYLETYEPIEAPMEEVEEEVVYSSEEISEDDVEELLNNANWLMMKEMIETEKIEKYIEEQEEAPMEQVVIEATSTKWSDAINAMTAISALVGNKKVAITKGEQGTKSPLYDRNWEWMNDADRSKVVSKRKNRKKTE